jgi:hypothetical protein
MNLSAVFYSYIHRASKHFSKKYSPRRKPPFRIDLSNTNEHCFFRIHSVQSGSVRASELELLAMPKPPFPLGIDRDPGPMRQNTVHWQQALSVQ